MPTLPTAAAVQGLLIVPFPEAVVNGAISDAALIFADCLAKYPDEIGTALVKYLAAHLLSTSQAGARGNVQSQSVDGTSYTLASAALGDGLRGSSFGKSALLFDSLRCLPDPDKTPFSMDVI